MEKFIIEGPVHLRGKVKISGSKNAALPILAATVLFREQVTIKNVPRINDIISILKIIEGLGGEYQFKGNTVTVNSRNLIKADPDPALVRNLRASILFLAPLLVRNGSVSLPHPGGCLIGSRPIDVHLSALEKMGALIKNKTNEYQVSGKLNSTEINIVFSVTGTENLIMAAVLTKGVTKIRLAAAEPHVVDLCRFLTKAGAKIEGIGTHNLKITGVDSLAATEYQVIPDQIEAGTFAIAAAASKGEVEIDGFIKDHQEALLSKLEQAQINYRIKGEDSAVFLPTHKISPFKIRTEIYPGFPTDLQAPLAVLATQAEGSSEIYETIFEGRLGYVKELSKMGASCIIRDAHQATITGPTPLFGAKITSFDLRAGATLIIAALIAQGESELDQIEIVDRGYENIEEKLLALGAKIKRVKD